MKHYIEVKSESKKVIDSEKLTVNEIEKKLPLRPYTYEWDKLVREYKYPRLTSIEKVMPWLFIILFSVSVIIPVIMFFTGKI